MSTKFVLKEKLMQTWLNSNVIGNYYNVKMHDSFKKSWTEFWIHLSCDLCQGRSINFPEEVQNVSGEVRTSPRLPSKSSTSVVLNFCFHKNVWTVTLILYICRRHTYPCGRLGADILCSLWPVHARPDHRTSVPYYTEHCPVEVKVMPVANFVKRKFNSWALLFDVYVAHCSSWYSACQLGALYYPSLRE